MDKQTQPTSPAGAPPWWTDRHTSAWERVKDAFQRDWEQTKNDLTSSGKNLKQTAVDTLKQTLGSTPIPPPGALTHPLEARDLDGARAKLVTERADAAADIGDAYAKIAETHERLSEDVSDAKHAAAERKIELDEQASVNTHEAERKIVAAEKVAGDILREQHDRIDSAVSGRTAADASWAATEHDARYGYGARMQYPPAQEWDDTLEAKLHSEWSTLDTAGKWETSRDEVRRGWNYGSRLR